MATKDYRLFMKQETNGIIIDSNGNQYTNMNLNNFQKREEYKPLQSDSCFLSTNVQGYRRTELIVATKSGSLWKKRGDLSSAFEKLNLEKLGEKKGQPWRTNAAENLNSSTLSLHIAAYENGTEEAQNGRKDGSKKTWKDAKAVFADSCYQDYFDFPRQPNGEETATPEVMQFKTSQLMSNLSAEDVAQRHLINIVNKYSLSVQDGKITQEEFANRLNSHHVALGLPEYNVHNTWMRLVRNVEDQFKNNGGRFADKNHERIASFQQRIDPTFCNPAGEIPAAESTVQEERVQIPEQSTRAPENMGANGNHDDQNSGNLVIISPKEQRGGGGTVGQSNDAQTNGNSGGRIRRRRELLLSEEKRLQVIQAAERASHKIRDGFITAMLKLKIDEYLTWHSILTDTKEKSNSAANEWTPLDQRIVSIAFRIDPNSSGWGQLALGLSDSLETSASKRKLTEADNVPPKKRSSTLINESNQSRTRSFPALSVTTAPASFHEQSRNHAPTQSSTKQSAEARQTPPSLNLQSSNQQQSTTGSNEAPSNVPNNDSAAASPPPQIQEAQQSHISKQIVQISTTMKYGAHRLQNFKLASICSGNIPVIQVLLPKNLDIHMCRGIGDDLSHRTKAFRPRATHSSQFHSQSNPQNVVEIRMLAGYSIWDTDDEDDKKLKICCIDADQKPVAVISLPYEFTIYESWVDETHRMIDIPLAYDAIFNYTP